LLRKGKSVRFLARGQKTNGVINDRPIALLRAQTSAVAKSIIKQLASKSLPVRQSGFALLHQLVSVLGGGLEGQIAPLVIRVEAALKSSDSGMSGAATSLKIEVLAFLGLLFQTHPLKAFVDELPKLIPIVVAAVREKFNKVAAEAFVTCTELVRVLRPVSPAISPIPASIAPRLESIYVATTERLASSDADEEVKGKGIMCLGGLLYHAGDQFTRDFEVSLTFLRDRLKNEVSRIVAVKVVGEVASSPVCKGEAFDEWIQECLVEVSTALRKVSRPLKIAAFGGIAALLERSGPSLPTTTSTALIADLQPLINDADINLLPLALDTISTLLTHDSTIEPLVARSILPRIFELVHSPLIQGPSLEGLLAFFRAYVLAGAAPLPLLKTLAQSADAAKKTIDTSGTQSGMQALVTSSRCIGVIVRASPDIAESIVNDYAAKIQVSRGK
jgi:cullin-associated NEDD8-dissociated protein 1